MPQLTPDPLLARVLRGGLTALGRRRLAQHDGTLTVRGLDAPIEIIRDRWGVPHIYARTEADGLFGQGFVQAQDRLWQMEVYRRLAQGRLSELIGPLALDSDRISRTFGFARTGRLDWATLPVGDHELLDAYVAGINAFLNSRAAARSRPIEFTLLRHTAEPWTRYDTLAFSRVMAWQMSHAWYGGLIRAQLIVAVGPERAAELEITGAPGGPAILPKGIEVNRLGDTPVLGSSDPFFQRRMGSNAWTVAPERSATGHAIFCNDMHLHLNLPTIWYEVHIDAGPLQVTGVSVPGLPTVIGGHNARIAWGATLAFTDCEDIFVEKFDSEQGERYEYKGEWLQAAVIPETIKIKGRAEPHVERVLVTRHGPVISDLIGESTQRLAVQSMALRPSALFSGFLRLQLASNWDEFVEAMRYITAPQLNYSYADVDDNIGYWVAGTVPVRAGGQGLVPSPGWTGEYDWVGEIPFEEMPHALNPAAGYIVHANNRIVGDDYPHYLGRVYMNGFRAARLAQMLENNRSVTLADCRDMQMDVTCLPGIEFVRLASEILPGPEAGDVAVALDFLRHWDGRLTTYTVGGTIYEVTRAALVRAIFAPVLGEELTPRWLGEAFHPVWMFVDEFYGHDIVALLRVLADPDSWWVTKAGGREALLRRCLLDAVLWLRQELGDDPAGWQWGRLHTITFDHALALQKPLDKVFNRGPLSIGGDTDTPLQTASKPGPNFSNDAWSPSMRILVDMGNLSNSQAVLPVGQSGQLGSKHYDDLLPLWAAGEYHPMLWTREQVEEHAEARLRLVGK